MNEQDLDPRAQKRQARKQEQARLQAEAKTPQGAYKNARGALLAIAVINLAFLLLQSFGGASLFDIIIVLVFVGLLTTCWVLSKKHYGWMTAALVIFSIDTVFWIINAVLVLLASGTAGFLGIGGIFLRVMLWVLIFNGFKAGKKLKAQQQQSHQTPAEIVVNPWENHNQ